MKGDIHKLEVPIVKYNKNPYIRSSNHYLTNLLLQCECGNLVGFSYRDDRVCPLCDTSVLMPVVVDISVKEVN